MLKRVILIGNNFTNFVALPYPVQETLIKHNSDMIVSLRAAVFFQMRKNGQNQIFYSLGNDDLDTVKTLIEEIRLTYNMNKKDYKAMEYKHINTIQKKNDNTEEEKRYDLLLSRVGGIICFDENLVILLSYVLLFSIDFCDDIINDYRRNLVEDQQKQLLVLLRRYICATYHKQIAINTFNAVLQCLGYLRELSLIKQKRKRATHRKVNFLA